MIHLKTISEYHKIKGLSSPHPLISVIDFEDITPEIGEGIISYVFDFYSIALKRGFVGKMKYGQQEYDFNEGVLSFIGPNQVFSFDTQINTHLKGFLILIHPDFLWGTHLEAKIKKFEFFEYHANEALFLSDKEEKVINTIKNIIYQEHQHSIDHFSSDLIISQLDTLLTYSDRFYNRQFITRKKANHSMVSKMDEILERYFCSNMLVEEGIPTVQHLSEQLHLSPNYLSRLVKNITGQSPQQHIHHKLIHLAKTKITTTDLSIGEIALALGFEHSQSFSKFFKAKTNYSPIEFRQLYN